MGKDSLFWIDLSTNLASEQDIEHQALQSRNNIPWPEQLRKFCGPHVSSLLNEGQLPESCQLFLGE